MERLKLDIDGMGCGGCVRKVRQVLDATPGVEVEDVSVGSATVAVAGAAGTTRQAVIDSLGRAGYPAREVGAARSRSEAGSPGQGGHCGVSA